MEKPKRVYKIIQKEKERQRNYLNLIPSENYCSKEVLEANGSVLTNKYSEGYPGKRYYQGNKYIDEIEELAIERAKKLFKAEHANVQPLSGSQANMAVYFGLLKPGDKIMAMKLDHGGHLSHGSKASFSGKFFKIIGYGVEKNGLLDMEKIWEIALRERPKMIVTGYTTYPRKIDFESFGELANEIGAYSVADISHIAGLVATGEHPSPFPYIDIVTTTTHKTLRGPRSAMILCKDKYAERIDRSVFPGIQGGPHEHTIAAKAICLEEASQPEFKEYIKQVVKNAKALAKSLMDNNIKLVSNGTDTHLVLIDLFRTLKEEGLGREVAEALEKAGIVTNANTIPFEPSTPFKPSGIRLGTPALTTRGMKEKEMEQIGEWIVKVICNYKSEKLLKYIRGQTLELCRRFK